MREVVLGVPVGDRTVGIVRSPSGDLVFSGRVDSRGGVVLAGFRPYADVVEGRTVVAGRLPPGAVAVVVIDDRGDQHDAILGNGVWVAVAADAAFSEPLVRFADDAGSVVAPPLPAGPRRRVTDTDEACPVCEAVEWVELDGEPEDGEVRCERCGFSVAAGLTFATLGLEDDEEDAGDEGPEVDEDWSGEHAAELASVTFPVYAVAGRAPTVCGFGSGAGRVLSVDVLHAGGELVHVTSTDGGEHPHRGLLDLLADLLVGDWRTTESSEAAMRIRVAGAERVARRRAARAAVRSRAFVIDGAAEPFEVVTAGDAWVAARDHYGVRVTVKARDVDPATVVLQRLVDPADARAGSTARPAPEVAARRRAAEGSLLDRSEVAALLDACGLGDHREAVLGAVLAGYRLEPGGTGRTRIGGLPDMAEGEAWPHGDDGIPYTFVAQIDCSALPSLDGDFTGPEWHHGGALLRVFAALDARVPEPGPAVALACPPGAPVRRAELPPRPDPMPASAWEADDESLRMLRETPVRPVPFLTAAVPWGVLPEGVLEDAEDRYRAFADRLAAGGAPPIGERFWTVPQLLGHAESVQGEDPRYAGGWRRGDEPELQPLDAWRVLLYVADGYEGMSFGDGGALAILAPVADLAAGRYDRLVTEPSMG